MDLNPIRALRIIEGLVLGASDDELYKSIYMVAHQAANSECAYNHPDFGEHALELEKQLVANKVIDPWTLTETSLEDILENHE